MTKKIYRDIHDRMFHLLLNSSIGFVKSFCQSYLPDDLCKRIQWDTLEPVKGLRIDGKTKKRTLVDLVFKVKIEDDTWLLLHFEHQSEADALMPLRAVQYDSGLILDYVRANPNKKWPYATTVVLHQNHKPYSQSLDIEDHYSDSAFFDRYCFTSRLQLIDLGAISDEVIRSCECNVAMMSLVLKYVRDKAIAQYAREIVSGLQGADGEIRQLLLEYIMNAGEMSEDVLLELVREFLPQQEDTVMSIGQRLRQEGMERGMEKGMREERMAIAINMLRYGDSEEKISKVTHLNIDEIQKIQDKK